MPKQSDNIHRLFTINIILSYQVCDPAYEIIRDSTPYGQDEQSPAPEITTTVTSTDPPPSAGCEKSKRRIPATTIMMIRGAVVAVLVYILLHFLTNGMGMDVSRVCAEHCPRSNQGTPSCNSNSLQSLCAEQWNLYMWKLVVVSCLFGGAIIGMDLILDKLE